MDSLYDSNRCKLYLKKAEREALLKTAAKAPRHMHSFYEVLHFAGLRISEALTLTSKKIDFEIKALVSENLKKRREGVFRAVLCLTVYWISSTLFVALEKTRNGEVNAYGYGRAQTHGARSKP